MYRGAEVICEGYGQEKGDKNRYEAENEKQSDREWTYVDPIKSREVRHNSLQYKLTHNQKNDSQKEHEGHVEGKPRGDQACF